MSQSERAPFQVLGNMNEGLKLGGQKVTGGGVTGED